MSRRPAFAMTGGNRADIKRRSGRRFAPHRPTRDGGRHFQSGPISLGHHRLVRAKSSRPRSVKESKFPGRAGALIGELLKAARRRRRPLASATTPDQKTPPASGAFADGSRKLRFGATADGTRTRARRHTRVGHNQLALTLLAFHQTDSQQRGETQAPIGGDSDPTPRPMRRHRLIVATDTPKR